MATVVGRFEGAMLGRSFSPFTAILSASSGNGSLRRERCPRSVLATSCAVTAAPRKRFILTVTACDSAIPRYPSRLSRICPHHRCRRTRNVLRHFLLCGRIDHLSLALARRRSRFSLPLNMSPDENGPSNCRCRFLLAVAS